MALMLIVEGFRSAVLSCSLVLVVPAIGLVLLRRTRVLSTLIAISLGVSGGAWSRFTGIWSLDSVVTAKVLLILGVTLTLLIVRTACVRRPVAPRDRGQRILGALRR